MIKEDLSNENSAEKIQPVWMQAVKEIPGKKIGVRVNQMLDCGISYVIGEQRIRCFYQINGHDNCKQM